MDMTSFLIGRASAGGGGGGSSDFSTAEVTLNLTPPTGIEFVAYGYGGATLDFPSSSFGYVCSHYVTEQNKAPILLYNGSTFVTEFFGEDSNENDFYVDSGNMVLSGDIAYEEGVFVITGDCSITAQTQT